MRAVFTRKCGSICHHPADAESRQEAQEHKLLHGFRRNCRQHAQAEEGRRSDEHGPSADTIGKNAEQHRTAQHTKEPCAKDRAETFWVDVPILRQGGRDKPHRLDVESIHKNYGADQNHDLLLERAEGMRIDQAGNICGGWVAGIRRTQDGGFRGGLLGRNALTRKGHQVISVRDVKHGYWLDRQGPSSPSITAGAGAGHDCLANA